MDVASPSKRKRMQPRELNFDALKSILRKFAMRSIYAGSEKLAKILLLHESSFSAVRSVLASAREVAVPKYQRDCRLSCDDVLLGTVTDALIAGLFQLKLINPHRLVIERGGEELLQAIDCTELVELCCTSEGTARYDTEVARIANQNALTLKELDSFPAEAVHLLDESLNLKSLSLSGKIPEATKKLLPRTYTYKDYGGLFPERLSLINAVELDIDACRRDFEATALNCDFSQILPNARIKRLVIAQDNMFVAGWSKMLRGLRVVLPNWDSLRVIMNVQSDGPGYDTYFRDVINRWSDKFEAFLRQEAHPLAIEVEASLDLEGAEDRIRARHYPKFACTVVHGDFEGHDSGTKFEFVRTEEFGEGRSLKMTSVIYIEEDDELCEEESETTESE